MEHKEWSGKTEGTPWMHRALTASLRVLPLWFVYLGMAIFVVPGFMVFSHKGYISMYHFFRRRMGCNRLKAFGMVYVNHVRFGQIIIDRFYMYAGGRFKLDIDHYDEFERVERSDDGFIMLSSHVGNYEAAGYSLTSRRKAFNALVFGGEAEQVMKNRKRMFDANNIHMITVGDDLSHLFQIDAALNNGEIVSLPGDRIFGSQKHVVCQFFGAEAKFPYGPFALAVKLGMPVLQVQVMKAGVKRYKVYITRMPEPDAALNKEERIKSMAQQYAAELEGCVRKHPAQWFNYYEFWEK